MSLRCRRSLELDAATAERDHVLSQYDRLRHLLRQLQRAHFGRSSEKLDPEQLHLTFEDIEQAIAATETADDKQDPVGARARKPTSGAPIAARFPPICRASM